MTMARRIAPLLLAALIAAGCAPMIPPLALPASPVPARFPDAAPVAAVPVTAADLDWPQAFPDAELQALIAQALAHNRDLRTAALRVQEARAAWGIQQAALLPSVGLATDASRSRVPADLNVTGRSIISSQYQVGLGLSAWELDLWGRLRSLDEAALQAWLASDEARRGLTLSLATQVAQSWLALRETDERLALAREAIASRNESLRIFSRRFDVGASSRLELEQVRILATQARALGAQLEQQRAQQVNALALLTGVPVDLPPRNQPLADAMVADVAPGLPSAMLAARPDIAAAEHRLRQANANIGAARAAFFPQLTLTTSLGTASAALDGLFEPGSRAWTFAPSLSLPLFTAGRLRANLQLSEVRRDIAVADYEKTIQSAFREVADALAARQWLAEQLGIQKEALAAQAERARLARLRYDAGSAAFLEVLDAQRDLLSAQQQRVQTQRALLAARVSLYAALGGGAHTVAATPIATSSSPSSSQP